MMMCFNFLKFVLVLALLAIIKPQACRAQFFGQGNAPVTGSMSRARSTASQHQLGLGGLGLSHGLAMSQTLTENNGGTTSDARSSAISEDINLGGLGIGNTFTNSDTTNNGAVSRSLSHDLNVGSVGIGTSLSRDNLHNGLGLQRSQNGATQLGLGFLNVDLSRNQQQQQSQALTQAQAQAQGLDAFASSNSNAETQSQQLGLLGFTRTQSESNAISGSRDGQTSASASGLAGGAVPQRFFLRSKRRAQFVPFAYPGSEFERSRRQFGRPFGIRRPDFGFQQPNYGFEIPQWQNANAQGLANSRNDYFEQQAGANTQSNQELNESGFFQNNGASSIGSNLARDGSSGQLSSANVIQDNSLTNDGFQSTNNAQSQALNFDQNQQQAANANAGTKEIQTADGKRLEAQSGSQATNNNQFGTSSHIANTKSVVYEDGDTHGSQADATSQSIFQGINGQNSAAHANSDVSSRQSANGFVSNTASSNASAVSRGGQTANAVASASSYSDSNGGGNALANANSNTDGFDEFGGAQANSGALCNFVGAQGFANGPSEFRAFKIRKRKSFSYYPHPGRQQQNQTSSQTLEITNDSTEMNWPKNTMQHYTQQQQRPQPKQPQSQQQMQQSHAQHLHYSPINSNSSTEQFAVIDENERHGRTFAFITNLIKSFARPKCIYPCTLDAYQQGRCCENFVVLRQPPPNVCCQQPLPLPPPLPPVLRPPLVIPPPPPTLQLIPTQCCNSCPAYGYYGPLPCIRYTFGGGVTLNMG